MRMSDWRAAHVAGMCDKLWWRVLSLFSVPYYTHARWLATGQEMLRESLTRIPICTSQVQTSRHFMARGRFLQAKAFAERVTNNAVSGVPHVSLPSKPCVHLSIRGKWCARAAVRAPERSACESRAPAGVSARRHGKGIQALLDREPRVGLQRVRRAFGLPRAHRQQAFSRSPRQGLPVQQRVRAARCAGERRLRRGCV